MSEYTNEGSQNIFLYGKNKLTATGIASVDSFDENAISATTLGGECLTVEGSGITITDVDLEKGHFEASGDFYGLFYSSHSTVKQSLFKRLFGVK